MDWIESDFAALRCHPQENVKSSNAARQISDRHVQKPEKVEALCIHPVPSTSKNLGSEATTVAAPNCRKRTLSTTVQSKRLKTGATGELSALEEYEAKIRKSNASRDLWIDKYEPKSKDQLAVNKKKISQVEEWLTNLQSGTSRRILVLTGPSGAGKSTTLRVLARELGIDVNDLENPAASAYNPDEDNSSYESIPTMFEHFLCAAKYGRACKEEATSRPSVAGRVRCSVTLIEEIPGYFLRNPAKLCDILSRFTVPGRTGIVFVLSENNASNSRFWTLFPPRTVTQLGLTVVKFNPVILACLKKHLAAVAKKEISGTAVTQEELDELVAHCRGDIRAGLTALEFSVESRRTIRKGMQSVDRSLLLGDSDRDQTLLLFRAIGRAFYVKRRDDQPFNALGLPVHLIQEARRPLTYVPEEIIEKCATSDTNYVAFLHENYPHFVADVDFLERAADTFSLAGYLTSSWTEGSQDRLAACAASVAIRGLMHLQRADVATKAHAIMKPTQTEIWKKTEDRKAQSISLLSDLVLSSRTSIFFTEVFPYWGKITPLRNTTGDFLREISSFASASLHRDALGEDEWFDASKSRRPARSSGPVKTEIEEADLQFSDIFADEDNDFTANTGMTNLYDTSQIQIDEMDDD